MGLTAKRYAERSLLGSYKAFATVEACLLNRPRAIRWPDGFVCALRGHDKTLYIQSRYATGSTTASGRELFDRLKRACVSK